MDLSNRAGAVQSMRDAIIEALREVGEIAALLARVDAPMRKKVRRMMRRKR